MNHQQHFCGYLEEPPNETNNRSNNIFELMTNEPIDALLKTGGTPGGEAEEDDDDQNLMEEEARYQMMMMMHDDNGVMLGGQVAAHQGPDELHARLERGNVPWIPSHCKP